MTARRLSVLPALLCVASLQATAAEQWLYYGGDAGGMKFAPLDQINPANVGQLQVAWQYRTGENGRYPPAQVTFAKVQVNPILLPDDAGGHLVVCSPFGRVIALDPETGAERWVYDSRSRIGGYASPADPEGLNTPGFPNCRGVAFWRDREAPADADCSQRIFLATHDLHVIALDARDGKACAGFGADGIVSVEPEVLAGQPPAAIGEVKFAGPPAVVNDTVVVGSVVRDFHRANAPSGAVRAFDARTGRRLWTFDPVPRDPLDPAWSGWTPAAARDTGGGNVWGSMSVDAERDLVFLPTSGPSPDFYGGTRPGDNRYADSLVALRGRTGEVAWHFQTVHHDVWDYDNAAQPTQVELRRNGQPFPAVIQATKTGMVYIFHRDTGEPYFPIEERPVPQGGVPGEALSPTQPFPTRPPPLVPHEFTADDFWGMTPFDRQACINAYGKFRYGGIFTPPSTEGSIIWPSSAGGVNWGGVAVDPGRKILVTNVIRLGHFAQLIPAGPDTVAATAAGENMMGAPTRLLGTPYALRQGALLSPTNQMPCTAPPFAELVAVDLEAGEIRWRSTLGVWDRSLPPPMVAPFSLPLPLPWGTPTFAGPMITAGGLVFIGATGDDRFRAFDLASGRQLWETVMPTGAFAVPMSYAKNGRQYVVVASGGHPFTYPKNGDQITAFALPATASGGTAAAK
jgi:quinoprotein glucose dehydrogenase